MLFETLSQPQIFWTLALFGFLSGFVFDVSAYIVFLCKKNKIIKTIFDFFASICVFCIFYLIVLKIDYGAVRIYHILTYFLSVLLQRICLGNIIANFFDWCYNIFINIIKKKLKRQKYLTKDDKTTKSNNAI